MDGCGVDGHSLFSADIGTILEVTVLPLLLSFQVKT
jgi:hypothetical protein